MKHFSFFCYIQKESWVSLAACCLIRSSENLPDNKQSRHPRFCNTWTSAAAMFLIRVVVEFPRFNETQNKRGKRLLSICPSRLHQNGIQQDWAKIEIMIGKNNKKECFEKNLINLLRSNS